MTRWTLKAREALRNARWRYQRVRAADRPNLAQPASYFGLFTAAELVELARAGAWPLPVRALMYLAAPARPAPPAEKLWKDLLDLAERSPQRLGRFLRAALAARKGVRRG